MLRKFLAGGIFFVFFFLTVHASSDFGPPSGFVNDFANLLSPAVRRTLEEELTAFEKATRHEIVIAVLPNLQGDTIENVAVKLFEDWKIGKQNRDNGALFLVAKEEKKMRIEVGYGLEGILTDAQSRQIIAQITRPAFQAGAYDRGVQDTVSAIEKIVAAEDSGVLPGKDGLKQAPPQLFNLSIYGLFAFIFLGNFLMHLFGRSKSWWPGGVWGAVLGIILGWWIFGLALKIIWLILGFGLAGLGLDYWASKRGPFDRQRPFGPHGPRFFGGFGGGGLGGGFGGFGGGRSGGGGSSGGW